ncbi:MAG: hypothetical protein FXV80_06330, partial [Candidatus Thioglobus sp.]
IGTTDAISHITINVGDIVYEEAFTFNGATYSPVLSPTGRTWLDRNLGARRVATSSADAESFGDLYQWGRPADGHQLRDSSITTTLSANITPNSADFISNADDWTTADSDTTLRNAAWGSIDGSGICPIGYRVPTFDELDTERKSWSNKKSAGAFASTLRLPLAKYRFTSGFISNTNNAAYWSSNLRDNSHKSLSFDLGVGPDVDTDVTGSNNFQNAIGLPVRCILNVGANPISPSIEVLTIDSQNFNIAENSAAGTAVDIVSTIGNPTAFSIINGNTGNAFAIDNAGQITVANNVLDFETKQIYTLTVKISRAGTASKIAQITINITDVIDTFTFNELIYGSVVSPTGRIWLDRNLGASQVATNSADADSFGDLYQWGRPADGHQLRTSSTTTTLADSITPNSADYIDSNTGDWTTVDSDVSLRAAVWGSFDGSSICPIGYRVPTGAELEAERVSWSSQNSAGAFASSLNLPLASFRLGNNFSSFYSSLVSTTIASSGNPQYLLIKETSTSIDANPRNFAASVRCILNEGANPVSPSIEALTIDSQNLSIAENSAAGTAVGVVSTI